MVGLLLFLSLARVTPQSLHALETGHDEPHTGPVAPRARHASPARAVEPSGGLKMVAAPALSRLGIAAGTWIPVILVHGVSSSDPGFAEFRTTRITVGRVGVLPAGTLLFATKTYNAAVQRLEFSVVEAVFRDGHTQKIQGVVCDRAHRAGLSVFGSPRPKNSGVFSGRWLRPLRRALRHNRALAWLPGDPREAPAQTPAYAGAQPALVQVLRSF